MDSSSSLLLAGLAAAQHGLQFSDPLGNFVVQLLEAHQVELTTVRRRLVQSRFQSCDQAFFKLRSVEKLDQPIYHLACVRPFNRVYAQRVDHVLDSCFHLLLLLLSFLQFGILSLLLGFGLFKCALGHAEILGHSCQLANTLLGDLLLFLELLLLFDALLCLCSLYASCTVHLLLELDDFTFQALQCAVEDLADHIDHLHLEWMTLILRFA
mmetsp:Transcript_79361/g.149821  ORF Transcript_79361/g.149821 Transcript_79361/m.149821 type:complete len:211 (-) Transcript_79361:253-885(-)